MRLHLHWLECDDECAYRPCVYGTWWGVTWFVYLDGRRPFTLVLR